MTSGKQVGVVAGMDNVDRLIAEDTKRREEEAYLAANPIVPVAEKILSMVELNGVLHVATGSAVYAIGNGSGRSTKKVFDVGDLEG